MNQVLRNPYEVLGVERQADAEAIKSAYRRLALQYHPDRNPGDREAEERFKELSQAYATLRDPESRARFDRFGNAPAGAGRPDFSTVDWQSVFQEADIHVAWDARGPAPRTGNAVFDVMFGMLTGMMRQSGLLPGEDREVSLSLPLEQARTGVTRRIRVPGASVCASCRGSGRGEPTGLCARCAGRGVARGGMVVDVTVPAKVRDGVKLRLRGLGGPGQPPGDVLVTVSVQLPESARLSGDDVFTEVSLTPLEARQGATLLVLGQPVAVPRQSKDGDIIRVPGGGLAGGDLIVSLRAQVWQGLWRGLRDGVRRVLSPPQATDLQTGDFKATDEEDYAQR